MPHSHYYRIRDLPKFEAMQVHPSNKSADLIAFCPSLQYTRSAGIHFPYEGRPVQEHPGEEFFTIDAVTGKSGGYLYDWIVKHPDGTFIIISEAEFASKYETA